MNVIIVGAGVAGFTAAEAARNNSPGADIILFNQERQGPYYRPRLPEVVSGKVAPEKIMAHPDEWFKERRLEFRKSETVVEICQDNNQLRGSLGSRLRYDRLLIATGATPFVPGIEGSKDGTLKGLYPLRTLEDAMALKYAAQTTRTALLLGSGLLGLEIAYALTQRGLTVHVLERADRILPFQTTPKSAALLQRLLTEKGFAFHLGTELKEVRGENEVRSAVLTTGEELEVGFVAIATGVRSDIALAKGLGLKTERGVVVDQFMETTSQGIYAAGDCAQTPDGKGGLWSIARLEGLQAGFNMVQEDRSKRAPYVPQPPSSLLKVAGIDLIAAGNIDPDGKLPFAEYETPDSYRKVVVNQLGALCGYTNLGTTEGNRELAQALSKKLTLPEGALEALGKEGFDFKTLVA
ncbi:MAG: FAD-dependent oxidoreductase [Deltaproteobacteria bacterium]|jgi:nitrite reductase (NADH) large subunit|nr:FAD-dependent oxidoreductase [Deltaproteobacteria bacterium]